MNNDCEIDCLSIILSKQINNHNKANLLNFKNITIDALDLISPFLIHSGSLSCDYTVGGLFIWIDYFKYQYCIANETLFIKGFALDDTSTVAFSMPIGKMQLEDSIVLLRQYCTAHNIKLELSAIPHEYIDKFKKFNCAKIVSLDQWADYIYDASALSTLTGNKYNKKRNHVNRFSKDYPQAQFIEINSENLIQVKECFSLICATPSDNKMANYERGEVWKILNNLDKYPFQAMCLMIENNVVAFTIGEVIDKTLYIHIEKTLHQYSGASETINKLYASHMLKKHELEWINREDSAGEEGLLKAKLSYHPTFLLKKYNVIF